MVVLVVICLLLAHLFDFKFFLVFGRAALLGICFLLTSLFAGIVKQVWLLDNFKEFVDDDDILYDRRARRI